MTMIDINVVIRLDKNDVRMLGLNQAVEVGDNLHIVGVAKVLKATNASVGSNGPGTLELEITKFGVKEVEPEQEPMKDYAKRRNEELRER